MKLDDEKPLYIQIAERIEDAILAGAFAQDAQVPSTTEISVSYKINPATALKGMNALVDAGLLYKKRGMGLFVAPGAATLLREKRKAAFYAQYVEPLLREAARLGISRAELQFLLERRADHERD